MKFTDFIGPAVIAALVSAVASVASSVWTAIRVTTLKSQLDVEASRRQTQFAWLRQRRAEAMMQIYACIVEIERVAYNLSTPGAQEECEHVSGEFDQAGRLFAKTYEPYRLLFSETLAKQLDDIENTTFAWRRGAVFSDAPGSYVDPEGHYLKGIRAMRGALEKEFRRLYGFENT
jgi:hypothetical protein